MFSHIDCNKKTSKLLFISPGVRLRHASQYNQNCHPFSLMSFLFYTKFRIIKLPCYYKLGYNLKNICHFLYITKHVCRELHCPQWRNVSLASSLIASALKVTSLCSMKSFRLRNLHLILKFLSHCGWPATTKDRVICLHMTTFTILRVSDFLKVWSWNYVFLLIQILII